MKKISFELAHGFERNDKEKSGRNNAQRLNKSL
jgi:hypothetical protein